jgi:hypothetical protein
MVSRVARVALILLAFATVAPEFAVAQTPPANVGGGQGQAPPRRGGFLEMLFGPSLLRPFRQEPSPGFGNGFIPPPQPAPVQPSEPPVPTVEILPKDKNAKKILVVGDFVAGGLAWGLDQMFAEEPKLAVVDDSNTNSGLVRTEYYDWNAELPKILNEERPDIVVVAVGANDRQQMRIGKDRIAPHSETWETTYVARIKGIADTLKVYGRPFFWVSAPPMRLAAAGRDMVYLNAFYTDAVEEAGGHFVDIWNGFTSDEGNYISSGPDVDGQLRALRASDGVNFTRAGRLKLAFYVEREIRRQTGVGAGAVDLLTSTNQTSQIEIGPDGQKRLVGPVISLTDPRPGASDALAGAPDPVPEVARESETPQYLMIVKGAALPAVSGRVDDFTWPPPSASNTAPQAAN